MPVRRNNEIIGTGGFANVYTCTDNTTEQRYAWKELIHSKMSEDDKARFTREVKIQSAFRHPNIVQILGARVDQEPYVIIMPLAEMSLRAALGRASIGDVKVVFQNVCSGIAHAHSNGVLHRDLKPDNILLYSDGSWRIVHDQNTALDFRAFERALSGS